MFEFVSIVGSSVSLGWASWYWIKRATDLIEIPADPLRRILEGVKQSQHPSYGEKEWGASHRAQHMLIGVRDGSMPEQRSWAPIGSWNRSEGVPLRGLFHPWVRCDRVVDIGKDYLSSCRALPLKFNNNGTYVNYVPQVFEFLIKHVLQNPPNMNFTWPLHIW